MATKSLEDDVETMYTTVEAARIIGVTPRTIQLWADSGVLPARKTPGGHRRISASVLKAFVKQLEEQESNEEKETLRVLVAEDEPDIRKLYQITMSTWDIPLQLTLAKDGHEALIRIGQQNPDILIVDLNMPHMDGFHMIQVLKKDPNFQDMDIFVVSALSPESITSRGGLPDGVVVYGKPIPFEKLEDHIRERAASASKARKVSS